MYGFSVYDTQYTMYRIEICMMTFFRLYVFNVMVNRKVVWYQNWHLNKVLCKFSYIQKVNEKYCEKKRDPAAYTQEC